MATLETQYKNYLKENPDSNYTYDEWVEYVFSPTLDTYENNQEDMSIWDVTLLDGLEDDDREINFKEISNKISEHLKHLKYDNGDISDIGNEVGFALGKALVNLTEEETNTFIMGIRHGISLTNNTHDE